MNLTVAQAVAVLCVQSHGNKCLQDSKTDYDL